jgi:uncharacterized membrane protein YbhN (UPF0104 family)
VARLHAHPIALTLAAFAIAIGAVVAVAAAYGFDAFADAWSNLHVGWLALGVCADLLAIPAYVICYRVLVQVEDGPELPIPLVLRIVTAGFGPFAAGGGFALDKRALGALDRDHEGATVRVLGLGAMEWALLAPAAWVCAVVLLAVGDHRVMSSLLWPWAVLVPIGFAVGLWLAVPARRKRICARKGRAWEALGKGLSGAGIVISLSRSFNRCWIAWLGAAVYWALDIAAFYAAIRFIGMRPIIPETILAYATGYALTRRSMPLGGAGVTEVMMTLSLHWVGWPVAPALAAVVVYRIFNFALPAIPALLVRPRIGPLITAVDEDRAPTEAERWRAQAPLGRTSR